MTDPTTRSVETVETARDQRSQALARIRLTDMQRDGLRTRLYQQVVRSWRFADLAGMHRSGWSCGENRAIILRQRIEALSDGELVTLVGKPAPAASASSTERSANNDVAMGVSRAKLFETTKVQLHVPGYLLHISGPVRAKTSKSD